MGHHTSSLKDWSMEESSSCVVTAILVPSRSYIDRCGWKLWWASIRWFDSDFQRRWKMIKEACYLQSYTLLDQIIAGHLKGYVMTSLGPGRRSHWITLFWLGGPVMLHDESHRWWPALSLLLLEWPASWLSWEISTAVFVTFPWVFIPKVWKGKMTIWKLDGKMWRKSITWWGKDPRNMQLHKSGEEDPRLLPTLHSTQPTSCEWRSMCLLLVRSVWPHAKLSGVSSLVFCFP